VGGKARPGEGLCLESRSHAHPDVHLQGKLRRKVGGEGKAKEGRTHNFQGKKLLSVDGAPSPRKKNSGGRNQRECKSRTSL